jgi:AraC-like DNA-binding protein
MTEQWLQAHLHDENQTIDSMAAALNVSRATLSRRFQSAYGESPAAVLRRRRLERAQRLLERGEGSVSEVAYAVGFASLSVFSRAFREHFNQAPSQVHRSSAATPPPS